MAKRKDNIEIGRAGELRVASELLLRGYEIFQTVVDMGVDLILGNGKRIQIKTAHKTERITKTHLKYNRYVFTFKAWKKRGENYKPHPLKNIDFVILWCIDDDIFLVVPAEEIRGKYSVSLSYDKPKRYENRRSWTQYQKFENAWDLLSGGDVK